MADARLFVPAQAQSFAPTPLMEGRSNNYRACDPIVDWISGGEFWISDSVGRAEDGATLAGQERDPQSHDDTLIDESGMFRMDMPQIVPAFGPAHAHLAYDNASFGTIFLTSVMRDFRAKSLNADFTLHPA
ncbi:hypothetical protein [Sulfitobacter guttiformis]|nr:hypothetical protein [Sulfitobacter guttiformis]